MSVYEVNMPVVIIWTIINIYVNTPENNYKTSWVCEIFGEFNNNLLYIKDNALRYKFALYLC